MGFAYKIADAGAVYFITCTVNKWVDIFTRRIYSDIVVNSLNHCTDNKDLIIYGYVIMSNHVHLRLKLNKKTALISFATLRNLLLKPLSEH